MEERNNSPQWILSCAMRAACPRCGRGELFDGVLKLAKHCNLCDLGCSFPDTAEGPVFFVMMGLGVAVTGFGIWLELTFDPPLWFHAITTVPAILLLYILPLRFLKGALVAIQYVNEAEQARFT